MAAPRFRSKIQHLQRAKVYRVPPIARLGRRRFVGSVPFIEVETGFLLLTEDGHIITSETGVAFLTQGDVGAPAFLSGLIGLETGETLTTEDGFDLGT